MRYMRTSATVIFLNKMKRFFILIIFLILSCSYNRSRDRLFKTLHHQTIVPREGVTIEFIDSTHYLLKWRQNSEKLLWSIEERLTGTYLIMDSRELRLEHLSDSVITFSAGEFTPTWNVKK
jgi:hypothetical protein